jgi:hypothetical protein
VSHIEPTHKFFSPEGPKRLSKRYESIHKAVQYKNSGAIQSGIMNERDVITMGLKEVFQCSRKAAEGDARQTSVSNTEKSEAAARRYCEDSTAASGLIGLVKFTIDRGKSHFARISRID